MAEYQLPGRPAVLKSGTFRIAEEPIAAFVWEEPDRNGHVHTRGEGLFHVSAVMNQDGTEDTTPRAMKLMSRTYENFMSRIRDMKDYGIHYSEFEYHVVVSENGDVRVIKD